MRPRATRDIRLLFPEITKNASPDAGACRSIGIYSGLRFSCWDQGSADGIGGILVVMVCVDSVPRMFLALATGVLKAAFKVSRRTAPNVVSCIP
jgi:hypothetical protein